MVEVKKVEDDLTVRLEAIRARAIFERVKHKRRRRESNERKKAEDKRAIDCLQYALMVVQHEKVSNVAQQTKRVKINGKPQK